jgi:hypothetical protein
MDHIKPLRLFDLSQVEARQNGFELDSEEQQHLRECEECQHVLAVFARQFSKKTQTPEKPEDAA